MTYAVKKVAVIFVLQQKDKYLFIKRAHTGACDGFYMLPGGHVDAGENILTAAVRELKEELDIDVKGKDLTLKLVESTQTHIHFFFAVGQYSGTLKNNEPEKHDNIAFLDLSNSEILPQVCKEVKAIENRENFLEANVCF